jgi:hypothetical protein
MAKIGNDGSWLVCQAQDLLNELVEKQFLLECLDETLGHVYFDADSKTKKELTKISTVLRAYDNEKAVALISQAIQLLDDARKGQ